MLRTRVSPSAPSPVELLLIPYISIISDIRRVCSETVIIEGISAFFSFSTFTIKFSTPVAFLNFSESFSVSSFSSFSSIVSLKLSVSSESIRRNFTSGFLCSK